MGKLILTLLMLASPTWAFLSPTYLDCESRTAFFVEQGGKTRHLKTGSHRISFSKDLKLTALDENKKRIAKLFPDAGLDGVLFNKKSYSMDSDQRTYWRLQGPRSKTLLSCELKYE